MDDDTGVLVDSPGRGLARVLLNRPQRRNALDRPMVAALLSALQSPALRAAVLASSDPGVFSAGADLDLPDAERAELSDELYSLYALVVGCAFPVVAVLEGPAVGGGAQLAMAADVRLASAGATLRFPGVGHGLAIGSWALPGLVGRGHAMELALSMRTVSADEALALGLVDRVVDDPMSHALALAEQVAGSDEHAVSRLKRLVADETLLARLEAERRANRAAWTGSVRGLDSGRRPRAD